jgi:hypothetical protein
VSKSAIPVLLMLVSIGAAAASAPITFGPSDPVTATTAMTQREKMRFLSAQLVRLEDQIYSDYNRLNSDHQYDIVCTMDLPTDTHFKNRLCLPAFVRDAQVDAAKDMLEETGSAVFLGGYPARPVSMVTLGKWDEFKSNYRKVFMSHPELLKLGQEYAALQKEYEATRK